MGQIVNFGREMIRINSEKNRIEYSTNGGNSWHSRYSGSNAGEFYSLCDYGNELLACTSKGVFYSKNGGNSCILVSRDLLRENLRRLLYKVTSYLLKRAKDCIILRMVVFLGTVANLTLFPSLFVIGE